MLEWRTNLGGGLGNHRDDARARAVLPGLRVRSRDPLLAALCFLAGFIVAGAAPASFLVRCAVTVVLFAVSALSSPALSALVSIGHITW